MEDSKTNEKLMNQVTEMKKQTIEVGVEMNSIERSKVAKLAVGDENQRWILLIHL